MSRAYYVVGNIKIKNSEKWDEYRRNVPETLAPFSAELVFRGKQNRCFSGVSTYEDIVVIRFPGLDEVNAWYSSAGYQALIPLREQAADVVLVSYEAS